MTDVMETKTGFESCRCAEHYAAGEQPQDKVETEINNNLYEQKMEPALRDYLTDAARRQLRAVKPGYVDTAAVKAEPIEEVAATPDKDDPRKRAARSLDLPARKNPAHETELRRRLSRTPDITSHFLVCEKELRATREGKSFLRLELGDRSGASKRACGTRFDQMAATFERDDFVKVQARVENYRNKLQLAIDKIRRADESEIDLADFFPHTAEDVDKLYARLLRARRVGRQSLAAATSRQHDRGPGNCSAPEARARGQGDAPRVFRRAARTRRQPVRSVPRGPQPLSGTGCRSVADRRDSSRHREARRIVLRALHRLHGRRQLLGHIILEYEQVTKKMDAIEGFPAALKTLVKHMLIAITGNMNSARRSCRCSAKPWCCIIWTIWIPRWAPCAPRLDSDQGEGNWTAFSGALERRFCAPISFAQDANESDAEECACDRPLPATRNPLAKGTSNAVEPHGPTHAAAGPRHSILDLAPLELDCMNALWPIGEGTVRDIHRALAASRPRAYTTVMTIMDRLAQKGIVTRRKVGRACRYQPRLSAEEARLQAVRENCGRDFLMVRRRLLSAHLAALASQGGPRGKVLRPRRCECRLARPFPRAISRPNSTGSSGAG